MVFADVLSDEIVDQVIRTLGDLRGCRASVRLRKREGKEKLACNAGRLMGME